MKKCKHAADVKVENSVTIKCNCYEEGQKDKDV